jgi:hypothetical protein
MLSANCATNGYAPSTVGITIRIVNERLDDTGVDLELTLRGQPRYCDRLAIAVSARSSCRRELGSASES